MTQNEVKIQSKYCIDFWLDVLELSFESSMYNNRRVLGALTTGAPERAAKAVSCSARSSNVWISFSATSRRGGGPGSVGMARMTPRPQALRTAAFASTATCLASSTVALLTC